MLLNCGLRPGTQAGQALVVALIVVVIDEGFAQRVLLIQEVVSALQDIRIGRIGIPIIWAKFQTERATCTMLMVAPPYIWILRNNPSGDSRKTIGI